MPKVLLVLILFLPIFGIALLAPRMLGDKALADAIQEKERAAGPAPADEQVLFDYGLVMQTPKQDLQQLVSVINQAVRENEVSAGDVCFSRQALARFLRGENKLIKEYIPKDHRAWNEEGLLVDRWKSPIDVRTDSASRFTLRSRGKDKKAGTDDDILQPSS